MRKKMSYKKRRMRKVKKLVMKSREMKLLSLGWNVISRLELSRKDMTLAPAATIPLMIRIRIHKE
jgi:hypothetical protein